MYFVKTYSSQISLAVSLVIYPLGDETSSVIICYNLRINESVVSYMLLSAVNHGCSC